MGHLVFVAMFIVFVAILVGKLYFSYIYAAKKQKEDDAEVLVDIDEQSKSFYVKKWRALVAGIVILIELFFLMYFFNLLKNESQHSDVFWALIDSLFLGVFIFIVAFIKCVRSNICIHRDGFDYFDTFRKKLYSKEEIEFVCRTTEFIFVKRKGCRMPVIIEAIYSDNDCLYEILRGLQSDLSRKS